MVVAGDFHRRKQAIDKVRIVRTPRCLGIARVDRERERRPIAAGLEQHCFDERNFAPAGAVAARLADPCPDFDKGTGRTDEIAVAKADRVRLERADRPVWKNVEGPVRLDHRIVFVAGINAGGPAIRYQGRGASAKASDHDRRFAENFLNDIRHLNLGLAASGGVRREEQFTWGSTKGLT